MLCCSVFKLEFLEPIIALLYFQCHYSCFFFKTQLNLGLLLLPCACRTPSTATQSAPFKDAHGGPQNREEDRISAPPSGTLRNKALFWKWFKLHLMKTLIPCCQLGGKTVFTVKITIRNSWESLTVRGIYLSIFYFQGH